MTKIDNGGSAFPAMIPLEYIAEQGKEYPNYTESGMSLRDWFAGQVLTSFSPFFKPNTVFSTDGYEKAAVIAYALADAMIARRKVVQRG